MLRIPKGKDQDAKDQFESVVQWLREARSVALGEGGNDLEDLRREIDVYRSLRDRGFQNPAESAGFARVGAAVPQTLSLLPGGKMLEARSLLSTEALAMFEERVRSLRYFHARNLPPTLNHQSEDGLKIRLSHRPLGRLGILLPQRGMAVSLLMALAVPAQVAGVEDILVALPSEDGGDPAPGVLAACDLLGIRQVLVGGGSKAVCALILGTPETAPVDLLVGEESERARLAMLELAGECEVEATDSIGDLCILTDGQDVSPDAVATELLVHAELGGPGLRALLCSSESFLDTTLAALDRQYSFLKRGHKSVVRRTLEARCRVLPLRSLRRGVELVRAIQPERLHLLVHTPHKLLGDLEDVGQIHVGQEAAPSLSIRDGAFFCVPSGTRGRIPTPSRFLEPVTAYRCGEQLQPDRDRIRQAWREFETH